MTGVWIGGFDFMRASLSFTESTFPSEGEDSEGGVSVEAG